MLKWLQISTQWQKHSVSDIDQYIHAATRENTRRSYQSAIRHYEVSWGGLLPATSDDIARYLSDHAKTLSVSTLKQRTSAIGQWHVEQGFPDPTKTSFVRKVLKGIRELHPQTTKKAKPLQLEELSKVINYLDNEIAHGLNNASRTLLRNYRDKALILIGFWRGFRSEELCRLSAEFIEVVPDGLDIFLPRSKGDRSSIGRHYYTPSLKQLCPTTAYLDWLAISKIKKGPVFQSINQWGRLSENSLHPNSIIPLIRRLLEKSSIDDFEQYSSHSLRRGFASWATDNQWDLSSLMEYVGWKDPKSALEYIEVRKQNRHFGELSN